MNVNKSKEFPMTRTTILRSIYGLLVIVLGNLQAWDSNVYSTGLWIVLLVSLAIGLPAVAVLVPLTQTVLISAIALSFILLVLARLTSPIPLPELFLILVPAVMGLILAGLVGEKSNNAG
jgi:hypothetical protein